MRKINTQRIYIQASFTVNARQKERTMAQVRDFLVVSAHYLGFGDTAPCRVERLLAHEHADATSDGDDDDCCCRAA
jgi:hypothetical protein